MAPDRQESPPPATPAKETGERQAAQIVEVGAGSEPQNAVTPGPADAGRSQREPILPRLFGLRREIPVWQAVLYGVLCIAAVLGVWWFLTYGETREERIISPAVLPDPETTFAPETLRELWVDRALTRNVYASLRRVVLGFALAALIGIPIGVLCGCFSWINAFFSPLTVFGRNIPIAALIPLTFAFFGIGEFQKVMFIFIACVAFIIVDTARAVADVNDRYIDTAFTLGAGRCQIIFKVLVPLAMPSIFNSLRLLFGLAFGYIMLAELITIGGESGGLGYIIEVSQKRNHFKIILLVLMVIPIVALAIDRLLYWVQRQLFPFQYGGDGLLHSLVRWTLHRWEDFKTLFRKPVPYDLARPATATTQPATTEPPRK